MSAEASPLKTRIQDDMKAAMRAQDKARLATIRLILAALKQREVDERKVLGDADVLAILDKMIKQRRESIAQYESGGRADLVAQETAEIAVIQTYLPQPLTDAEINQLIDDAIAQVKPASVKDMGAVMNVLKPKLQGRCDIGEASKRVRSRLGA